MWAFLLFSSPCHPIHTLFFFLKHCAMFPDPRTPSQFSSPQFLFKPEDTLLLSLVVWVFLIVLFPSFPVRSPGKFWSWCSALCLSYFMEKNNYGQNPAMRYYCRIRYVLKLSLLTGAEFSHTKVQLILNLWNKVIFVQIQYWADIISHYNESTIIKAPYIFIENIQIILEISFSLLAPTLPESCTQLQLYLSIPWAGLYHLLTVLIGSLCESIVSKDGLRFSFLFLCFSFSIEYLG